MGAQAARTTGMAGVLRSPQFGEGDGLAEGRLTIVIGFSWLRRMSLRRIVVPA